MKQRSVHRAAGAEDRAPWGKPIACRGRGSGRRSACRAPANARSAQAVGSAAPRCQRKLVRLRPRTATRKHLRFARPRTGLGDLFAREDLIGTSQHLLGGDPCRVVLDFERQSVPRSRDVDKDGSHPEGLRAIGHLPTFGGKLSKLGCVDHPRPR